MKNGIWNELLTANTGTDWAIALGFVAGGWVLGQALLRLSYGPINRWISRTANVTDDLLLRALRGPLVVIICVFGLFLGYEHLNWPVKLDLWMSRALHVAIALSITWLIARVITRALAGALERGRTAEAQRGSAIPAIVGVVNILVWGLGLVVALSNAGYDVGALLAGIGIGGLAMAMAAKDTLANVFGGITVFADQPFHPGDRIRVAEHTGRVEAIGLRSTRLRTIEGPLVVIPNHLFTESVVVNLSAEPSQRVRLDIGLVRETPPERVERALAILGEVVLAEQDQLDPKYAASLNDLKADQLNLLFIYHVRKNKPVEQVRTRINLDVLRRFHAEGLRFAYPTSLQYAVPVEKD